MHLFCACLHIFLFEFSGSVLCEEEGTEQRRGILHLGCWYSLLSTVEIKGFFASIVLECTKSYALLYIVCWGGDQGKGKAWWSHTCHLADVAWKSLTLVHWSVPMKPVFVLSVKLCICSLYQISSTADSHVILPAQYRQFWFITCLIDLN